jgi:2-keto-3-deoxy-L-rhamnonate aldolase RhmA
MSTAPTFKSRLTAGEPLIGTFIKTPTTHAIEILGALGYDFAVIDAEHAPIDRAAIDVMLLAAQACGIAGLVRVAGGNAADVGNALDCGAAGVLVPHVDTAAKARAMAELCRFLGGRRGFSGSTRASGYGGTPMARATTEQDARATFIAMIEDPAALDEIDAIAATDGVDALFIGRADLAVALGESASNAPAVMDAVTRIVAAARTAGKPVCVMVGEVQEAQAFRASGASAFIVASDQGFLRKAAGAARQAFDALRAA